MSQKAFLKVTTVVFLQRTQLNLRMLALNKASYGFDYKFSASVKNCNIAIK